MESGYNAINTETGVLFGDWLVNKGVISQSDLAQALDEQQRIGGKLGEVLLRLKLLSESDITAALSEYLSIERVELDNVSKLDMNVARLIPESIAKRFCAAAIGEEHDSVVVAMAGGGTTVRFSPWVATTALASLTWAVTLKKPAAVGVPVMAPVAGSTASPAGRPMAVQVYGRVPPVALNVWL